MSKCFVVLSLTYIVWALLDFVQWGEGWQLGRVIVTPLHTGQMTNLNLLTSGFCQSGNVSNQHSLKWHFSRCGHQSASPPTDDPSENTNLHKEVGVNVRASWHLSTVTHTWGILMFLYLDMFWLMTLQTTTVQVVVGSLKAEVGNVRKSS